MNIRETTEAFELASLSNYATLSAKTKGRTLLENRCEIRTDFQRDRDRIIHCNSFRRLKHKTQVFLSPLGDHYRTRLTHTLEVAQIARTIARALRLNEDLTEAIALGHDLGHTPFGHSGEQALNNICEFGFVHAEQSVRVVETLEKEGKGLNLTLEVRDGIKCHSNKKSTTLEGRVVKLSDKVAYINHDIEDAISARIMTEKDLPFDCTYVLGKSKSERISTIINSVIKHSVDDIVMSDEVLTAHNKLKQYMFENVYFSDIARKEADKSEQLIKILYEYYCKNPHKLPDFYKKIVEESGINRASCDFIAGMTDRYAVEIFSEIYIPKSFTINNF
jgi:dGTPase